MKRASFLMAAGLAVAAGGATAAAAEAVIGHRGDGSGVYPSADPPIEWDGRTGKNILWKAPMPNWGHSCPIEVPSPVPGAGARVFVMVEPGWKSDWPVLLCLDARDGRELWRREVNHLAAAVPDPARRQQIAATWHELLGRYREAYTLFNGYFYSKDREAGAAAFERHGFLYGGWSGGGYGQLRKMRFKDAEAYRRQIRTIEAGGLNLETWQHQCGMGTSCVGQAFPTPLSDGRFVYVATGLHSFACFDLNGNARWLRSVPGARSQGGKDYCKNARQPLLCKDLFISDVGNLVRAFDRRSGELRWSHETPSGHCIVSPVVLKVGQTDVLWTAGPAAFLLPGGRPLEVRGWTNEGACAVLNTDRPDTVFFSGGGEHGGWEAKGNCETPPPAAVRLSLNGGLLQAKVLWSGVDGQKLCCHTGLVYCAGKLYHPAGIVLDAATGKVLAGSSDRKSRNRATPATRQDLAIAGGRIYGLHEGRGSETEAPQEGIAEVHSLDGRKLAENRLANDPPSGEKVRQIIEQVGYRTWRFNYACPFCIAGGRIYIRSYDWLYCIGRK